MLYVYFSFEGSVNSSEIGNRRILRSNLSYLTSLRMAFPSFVRTIPPIGSSSIFSIDLGPRVVRTMSETALAALMLAA